MMSQPFTPQSPQSYEQLSASQNIHVSAQSSGSFYAKVMMAFGLAILTSAAGTYTGFQFLGKIFIENPLLMYIFFVIELVLVFTARMWSTKHPVNYLLFVVFAFLSGITLVPLLGMFLIEFGGFEIIIKAFLATTLVFTATALIGWTTNRSLTGLRGFLTISLLGMIIVGIMGIFLPWSNNFEMIYAGFGVIVFGAYTMYDIQRLKTFESNRFIDAALELYLDLFNIFVFVLRLIGGVSRD